MTKPHGKTSLGQWLDRWIFKEKYVDRKAHGQPAWFGWRIQQVLQTGVHITQEQYDHFQARAEACSRNTQRFLWTTEIKVIPVQNPALPEEDEALLAATAPAEAERVTRLKDDVQLPEAPTQKLAFLPSVPSQESTEPLVPALIGEPKVTGPQVSEHLPLTEPSVAQVGPKKGRMRFKLTWVALVLALGLVVGMVAGLPSTNSFEVDEIQEIFSGNKDFRPYIVVHGKRLEPGDQVEVMREGEVYSGKITKIETTYFQVDDQTIVAPPLDIFSIELLPEGNHSVYINSGRHILGSFSVVDPAELSTLPPGTISWLGDPMHGYIDGQILREEIHELVPLTLDPTIDEMLIPANFRIQDLEDYTLGGKK